MSITLYGHPLSGHSHRVQLALSLLGVPHTVVNVDLMKGEHKAPEFIRLNPFGQVPVLDDGGTILFDSNAILVYLATRYDPGRSWLPIDPVHLARVQNPKDPAICTGECPCSSTPEFTKAYSTSR